MDALTDADVEAVALLARLQLSPEEVARLRGDLTSILDHMDRLKEVNTEGVEPMAHAIPMSLRLRDDVVEPSLPVEVALAQAPDRADDSFRVPNIIKTASDS